MRASQEVVVSATAIPISAEWTGRTVIVLTAADLVRLGIRSVADALRLAPGLDVRARGPFDIQTDFSIRGATFGQNLVLVDGRRLNDSQSGHHNGDVPAVLAGIDRIEIVTGAGSAVHGADALGGTLNIVTKNRQHLGSAFAAGQHGYVSGQVSAQGGRLPGMLGLSVWASRSGGFETGREFAQGGGSLRASLGRGWSIDGRHVSKAFGAKNFYGPSLSKEWTDQTIAGANWLGTRGQWSTTLRLFARNHGDHFRWDLNRPGFAENRHRTNAGEASARMQRDFRNGAAVSFGGGGGGDWVRSSNLGNHDYGRGHAFVEGQVPAGKRSVITAGLRGDRYTDFGGALSPSVSGVVQITSQVRVRASAARAFRVPTFTELYYHDLFNLGSPDLRAEHGTSVDGGIEWSDRSWTATLSTFGRWDENVIDWVRPTPADVWRTTNVRDVASRGMELSLARKWTGGFARGHFSALDLDAPSHDQLSKYVLEFARYSVGGSLSTAIAHEFRVGATVDYRHRADGQKYALVGLKLSHPLRGAEIFLDGTNLLNETYREIAGVNMPGRWVTVGVTINK